MKSICAHLKWLAIALIALVSAACSTPPSRRSRGDQVDFSPGWTRVRSAISDAAHDPWVWTPLASAAVLQIDNWDRRTSDWARENTPIFGSRTHAENWSNGLRSATVIANFGTLLAIPSSEDSEEWLSNKSKNAAVTLAAIGTTSLATKGIKSATHRERPNSADMESLPSGHASSAAVNARMAIYNLNSIELDSGWHRGLSLGFNALSIGTSWARVESGAHYPSDTLIGMALGNFVASFFNSAFLGLQTEKSQLALSIQPDEIMLSWCARY